MFSVFILCTLSTLQNCGVKMEDGLASGVARHDNYWGVSWIASISIDQKSLADSPQWGESEPNPPLNGREALSQARTALAEVQKNMPKGLETAIEEWKVGSLELLFARLRDDESAVRWYWIVNFEAVRGEEVWILPIVVMMNGVPTTPQIRPYVETEDGLP